jgi:hypothetical protein
VEPALERLLAEDPLLADFGLLEPEAGDREKYFMRNSVRGYIGYLEGRLRRTP